MKMRLVVLVVYGLVLAFLLGTLGFVQADARAPTVTLSGSVSLQGRSTATGAVVRLEGDGGTQEFVVGAKGVFSFLLAPGEYRISVHHPLYLWAQRDVVLYQDQDCVLPGVMLRGGDVTGDGLIDILDLAKLSARYGSSDAEVDINVDGIIDICDLSIMAGNFREQAPIDW